MDKRGDNGLSQVPELFREWSSRWEVENTVAQGTIRYMEQSEGSCIKFLSDVPRQSSAMQGPKIRVVFARLVPHGLTFVSMMTIWASTLCGVEQTAVFSCSRSRDFVGLVLGILGPGWLQSCWSLLDRRQRIGVIVRSKHERVLICLLRSGPFYIAVRTSQRISYSKLGIMLNLVLLPPLVVIEPWRCC